MAGFAATGVIREPSQTARLLRQVASRIAALSKNYGDGGRNPLP